MDRGNKKIEIMLSVVVAILLISMVATAFGLFTYDVDLSTDGNTAIAAITFSEVELVGSVVFAAKGDTYTKTLSVENIGSVPIKYSLDFSITKGGLENAVLAYLDGKLMGTLCGLFSDGVSTKIDIDNPLFPGESYTHTLALEYHLGANSYYSLAEKDFSLSVSATASQIFADSDKYLFASNFYELSQILNNYNYSGYTVQLTGDVVMQQSLSVGIPLALNLGGRTLTMGNFDLVFDYQQSGVSRIYNTRQTGGILQGATGEGSIVVDTPSGYVRNETGTELFSISNADIGVFFADYKKWLDGVLGGKPIDSYADIKGIFGDYLDAFDLVFSSTNEDIIDTQMHVFTPEFTQTVTLSFTISAYTQTYHARVCGSDADSIAETVLRNNFYLLPDNYVFGTPLSVNGDVLLPTKDRSSGHPIVWVSSNRDILDESGKYNTPYINASFELSAIVAVNGVNILKIFPMSAVSKSPEERLREILLERGKLTFLSFDLDQPLIDPAQYTERMGLEQLSYAIPENVDTVISIIDNELGYKSLHLSGDPGIDTTYVEVSARFADMDEEDEPIKGRLEVYVDIVENISYHNSAMRLVMSYINEVIEEQENILNSFSLPPHYRTKTTIEYIVKPGTVGEIYQNPEDVEDYCIPKNDNTGIEIIKEMLPQENTTITVEVKITHEEDCQNRYFQIPVAGVLHYSPKDIEDINLYQELRKIYDTDNDWVLTRDEIDGSAITAFETGGYHNITSIKGIEFFTDLTSIKLNNNNIIDISPLSALYNLVDIDLSNNSIRNIDALKNLGQIVTLDLSNNDISDIGGLKNKEKLQVLTLSNNLKLSDFSAIAYMPALQSVYLLNTLGVTSNDAENNNALITAYQNIEANEGSLAIYKTSQTTTWTIAPDLLVANTIANYMEPIYEFHNVLYLPASVKYKDNPYYVTWQCNAKAEDIVNIVKVGDTAYRAYITQPAGDTGVKLSASVTYKTTSIIKFFDVVSRRSYSAIPQIYKDTSYVSAVIEIPDENLRRQLFKTFDADNDNYLSADEMGTPRGDIDLSGLGITSLKGIEYFSAAITSLILDNNNIQSYQGLEALDKVNTLSINGNIADLTGYLPYLSDLTLLKVYGLSGINSEEGLAALYDIYKNKSNAVIYKDSTDTVWNPYIEPMAKALTNIMPYITDAEDNRIPQYILYGGTANSLSLPQSVVVTMYDGAELPADITYTKVSGSFTLDANTSVYMNYNATPARDDFGQLKATITILDAVSGRTATVARNLTIVCVSDTDLDIQTEDGDFVLLADAVPNDTARRNFLARLPSAGPSINPNTGRRYLARSNYVGFTSITYYGVGEYGIKGVELMKNSNLNRIILYGYADMPTAGFVGIDTLNSIDYPNLRTLNFNNSIVDLFDITKVSTLQTLTAPNCVKVVMDKVMEVTRDGITKQERLSVFGKLPHDTQGNVFEHKFPSLTSFTITNSNVRDFWALQDIAVTTLNMYSNPASNSTLTNYFVEAAYANLSLGTSVSYRIINSGTYWTSSGLDITDLGVSDDDDEAAKPYPFGVNYFELGSNEEISFSLPRKYKSQTENVFWTATKGGSAFYMTTDDNYKHIEFEMPALATEYTVMRGTVKTNEGVTIAVIDYVFINLLTATPSDAVGYAKTGSNYYLDIRYAMMDNGVFVDFRFAYFLLGKINDDNGSGLFKKESVEASGLTVIHNAENGRNDVVIYNDIKGIRYFTGVTEVSLDNHTIADISELFYLEDLQYLSMCNNRIQSLKTSGGLSVFHNMADLYFIRLYLNQGIGDYSPIVDRASPDYARKLTSIVVYRGDFAYYPAVIDDGKDPISQTDDDPEKMLYMANTWWQRRESANIKTDATLHIVSGQQFTTYAQLQNFFEHVKALQAIARPTAISGGDNLGPSVTYNNVMYQIGWYAYGSSNAITVDSFGDVTQLSTELASTNHWLKMRVSINMDGYEISRLMHIELAIQGNYDDEDLLVELDGDEATKYQAKYGYAVAYSRNDATYGQVYTVSATDVIPDANLRNFLFSVSDVDHTNGTKDGTISMADRYRVTSVTLTNRAIDDISGFELFYRVSTWTFETGQMKTLPQLFIRTSSNVVNLYFRRYYNLIDLQAGLDFDGDGAGGDYTSLYAKIERLEVQYSPAISDTEYAYIASMPKLERLNIRYNRYSCIDVFHDLYDTIERFYTNNNNAIYANFNTDQYRRLVLDSPYLLNFADVSYVNSIFKEYLALEPYEINVPKALPSSFQLRGYDRLYNLSWSEIIQGEQNNYYTIENIGGIDYLTVETGAPQTIFARVSVSYSFINEQSVPTTYTNTYSEDVEIITKQDVDPADQYYQLEGTIWMSAGDVDIRTLIPDPMLRYYFIKYIDTDSNGYISYSELGTDTATFSESNATISSLEGIGCLYNLKNLTLNRFYGYDLSPLAPLATTLETLNLTSSYYQLRDISIFDGFTKLKEVNFSGTGVLYFGFAANNNNIVVLKNITSSATRYAMFSRNTWAYSRMYNDLSDVGAELGTDNTAGLYYSYINTQDEKYASCILNAIDIAMQEGDVFEAKTNENHELSLSPIISYQGNDYTVEWHSLSDNLLVENGAVAQDGTVTNGSLEVSDDGLEDYFAFVARIQYNGGSYERLFVVRYQS